MKSYLRQSIGALRLLLVFTVVLGVLYPLAITAIAQVPGLKSKADGSLVTKDGRTVGSSLLGQAFTDKDGNAVPAYFQSRPSAAGYAPTASSPSNLGPESVEDVLPDPSVKDDAGKPSLLTQVCTRSLDVGKLEGVDGRRAYCSPDGTGSVLRVFYAGPGYAGRVVRAVSVNQACPATPFVRTYRGVTVTCGRFGADYSRGEVVALRGDAPADPAVPADAVTASGSGLDPQISPAYARIQEARVAKARGITVAQVAALVRDNTDPRFLGFMGEDAVDVLQLNLALDRRYPAR